MNDPKKRTLENSDSIPKIIPKKIKTIDFTIIKNICLPRLASHLSHDLYDAVEFNDALYYRMVRPDYFLNYPNNFLSMDGLFLSAKYGRLRPMKTQTAFGRAMIKLWNGEKNKGSSVARWICLLFCDKPERHKNTPLDQLTASHITNHDGTNDIAANLVWETYPENKNRDTGKKNPKAAATHSRQITVTSIDGSRSETFDSAKLAADAIVTDHTSLIKTANGKQKKTYAKKWNLRVTAAYVDTVPDGVIIRVNLEFSHGILIPDNKAWFITNDGKHIKPNQQNWKPVRDSDQRFGIRGKKFTIYQILAGTVLGKINPNYPENYSLEYLLKKGEDRDSLSVEHLNGNHGDNRIENLRWGTPAIQGANMKSNVPIKMWPKNREFNAETDVFVSCAAAGQKYDVNENSVSKALLNGGSTYKPHGSDISYTIQKIIKE